MIDELHDLSKNKTSGPSFWGNMAKFFKFIKDAVLTPLNDSRLIWLFLRLPWNEVAMASGGKMTPINSQTAPDHENFATKPMVFVSYVLYIIRLLVLIGLIAYAVSTAAQGEMLTTLKDQLAEKWWDMWNNLGWATLNLIDSLHILNGVASTWLVFAGLFVIDLIITIYMIAKIEYPAIQERKLDIEKLRAKYPRTEEIKLKPNKNEDEDENDFELEISNGRINSHIRRQLDELEKKHFWIQFSIWSGLTANMMLTFSVPVTLAFGPLGWVIGGIGMTYLMINMQYGDWKKVAYADQKARIDLSIALHASETCDADAKDALLEQIKALEVYHNKGIRLRQANLALTLLMVTGLFVTIASGPAGIAIVLSALAVVAYFKYRIACQENRKNEMADMIKKQMETGKINEAFENKKGLELQIALEKEADTRVKAAIAKKQQPSQQTELSDHPEPNSTTNSTTKEKADSDTSSLDSQRNRSSSSLSPPATTEKGEPQTAEYSSTGEMSHKKTRQTSTSWRSRFLYCFPCYRKTTRSVDEQNNQKRSGSFSTTSSVADNTAEQQENTKQSLPRSSSIINF